MTGLRLSWGRYPNAPQRSSGVLWRDEIEDSIRNHKPGLAFGNGRSYGDVCLAANNQVLDMSALKRVIGFNQTEGIIRAEAGISLNDLLSVTIPKGWFLPVVPGTGFATLGGAIANDVHGKNHHRNGTFGCHVLRIGLFRDGQIVECSLSENSELFRATISGLGLTGFILWAEIKLQPVKTSYLDCLTVRFNHLERFFELADQFDTSHEYGVAWIDCLATGASRGRGAYFAGNHASYATPSTYKKPSLSIPFTPPISVVNQVSLKAFNELYFRSKSAGITTSRVSYQPYFFPLDSISQWNRMYGPRGFQQYQCVIPVDNEKLAIAELLKQISRARQGSFLAVLKRCGPSLSPGLLSFPIYGTSLALDFPNNPKLTPLFDCLDKVVREAGGRLYPAKDAHMKGSDFRHYYPEWETVEQWRVKEINSQFWQRVTQ